MHQHPYLMEVDLDYARERVATVMASTRPVAAPVDPGRSPAVSWLRRGLGRRLIATGEWLAGPTTGQAAPAA